MKSIVKFAIFILLAYGAAFVACTRDPVSAGVTPPIWTPPPPPPPPPLIGKTIKVKVVEYNSGNPITGAAINLRPDFPNMNTLNLITDQNGTCSFVTTTNKTGYITTTKPGYWDLMPYSSAASPILFYPDSTIYNPNASYYECDSFVVKLFPKYYATIHLTDSSHLLDYRCATYFLCKGLFNFNGITHAVFGDRINLHPSIDTTFQFPVLGNIINELSVWTSLDDDCFIDGAFNTSIHFFTGNNMTVNIRY